MAWQLGCVELQAHGQLISPLKSYSTQTHLADVR